MVIKQEKCRQLVHIPHLFHPVGVLLSSALADVHLCCVDTAWLWGGGGAGCSGSWSRWSLFKIDSPHICSVLHLHSPQADGRPRMPSPGCPGSSSPPCPSSCQSCHQQKEATENVSGKDQGWDTNMRILQTKRAEQPWNLSARLSSRGLD